MSRGSSNDDSSLLVKTLNKLYGGMRTLAKLLLCFNNCFFCKCECLHRNKNSRKETTEGGINIDEGDSPTTSTESVGCSIPKRFLLLFMVFLGFLTMYALRANLNVAIGAMVNNHTVIIDGRAVKKEAEFDWDSRMQGTVLGSLYYGYPILQIPGGWLSLKFGGTRIFGYGVFMASILTIFTAPAARFSVYALIAVRAGEGLFLGVLPPCHLTIWSKWSHPMERTIMVAVALSGCSIGTIITMPLSGMLTKYGFDGGWPSVFYCFGGFGVLWFFAWTLIVRESPSYHPSISQKEKEYLETGIGTLTECKSVPWKPILTSKHLWAVVAENVAVDWGLYTILICLPTFLLDVLHFNIQAAGFIAALPFVARAFMGPVAGVVSDILRKNGVRTKTVRIMCCGIGAAISASTLVLAGYCTSRVAVIICMCLSTGFNGVQAAGYEVNMLDIAPGLAGIVMGVSNAIGTLSGFVSPMLVGILTQNKKASEWQTVFWITAGIYLVGASIFCILLDDQPQPWGMEDKNVLEKEVVNMEENDTAHENMDTKGNSVVQNEECEPSLQPERL